MHIHTLTLTWAYILTRVCICMPHGSCVSGPTVCHSCLPFNIFPPCFTGFCFRFRAFLHVCSTCQPRQQISTINTCSTLCVYTCIYMYKNYMCIYTAPTHDICCIHSTIHSAIYHNTRKALLVLCTCRRQSGNLIKFCSWLRLFVLRCPFFLYSLPP